MNLRQLGVFDRHTGQRSKRKAFAMLAFLTVSSAALIGPLPALAQSYSFSGVSIEGNSRVDAGTILSYAGISSGQSVSAGQLNDAYQRLIGSGLFEAVDLVPSGNRLVIKVTEFPTVNRIAIEGNKRLKDDRLLPLVKTQARRVYSPDQARADAAEISKAYEATGRLAAKVTPKIIRRDGNRVDLVFEVSEGAVVENESISFVGNRDFSDRRLRRVLATKQAGIFRRLVQRDTYIPERIEFDKQVLRDFYLSRGYIDFRVDAVSAEVARERDASFITFNISEGQSYRFGSISVASEIEGIDAAEFNNQLKIRKGSTYNPAVIDNVITRMETLALRKGYSFVRVDPRVTRHDREGLLDVQFTLVAGPRVFVERIDIEGNQTTLDRVVRAQFRTVEGDPFNPREIRQAAERIRALGFFSSADVQARQGTASDQVIVDVDVEEQPTGSLGLGVAFSRDSGAGLNIEFKESNFLGRGQGLSLTLQTADGQAKFGFGFLEPNLLGRDLAFRLNADWQETDNFNASFSTRTGSITPQLEFPISENGRLAGRLNVSYGEIFGVNEDSSAILKKEEELEGTTRFGLGWSYQYDNRVGGLSPRSSVVFRFNQDFYGLGDDTSFIKSTVRAAAERKVWNDEVTLRAVFEGGAINTLEGDTLITDRFLLGSGNFRGFRYGGIGPRDTNVDNNDALGGHYYAVAKLEAEFPLGLPEEYGIRGGAFVDVGSLWGLSNVMGGADGDIAVDDSAHLRATAGLSLFWNTPIGPLRFNFSRALQKEDYDKVRDFDISISTSF